MRRWIMTLLLCLGAGALAWEATLLATPFVLMWAASAKAGKGIGPNQFAFGPMTTAENQTIVRPSPDLSYSICMFDVSKGPVLVRIEPVPNHYWSVSVFDARTDVAAVRSDRDTGGKAAMIAIARDGQAVPQGWERVPVSYDRGIVLLRILLADKAEFPAVDALRRKSTCTATP